VDSKETLSGILRLETRNLNHAIVLVSKHLAARIAAVDIRQANEAINRVVAERRAALAK
jgi:hypothetical protein